MNVLIKLKVVPLLLMALVLALLVFLLAFIISDNFRDLLTLNYGGKYRVFSPVIFVLFAFTLLALTSTLATLVAGNVFYIGKGLVRPFSSPWTCIPTSSIVSIESRKGGLLLPERCIVEWEGGSRQIDIPCGFVVGGAETVKRYLESKRASDPS